MRATALTMLALAALVAGCGGDTKTVTETRTVTTTTQTPPANDQDAILDAAVAFYAAGPDSQISRDDLTVVKTNGTFADVNVANEAHAILKKAADTWIVVFDGNGSIPPETRQRFEIPADYGG